MVVTSRGRRGLVLFLNETMDLMVGSCWHWFSDSGMPRQVLCVLLGLLLNLKVAMVLGFLPVA